MKILFAIKNMNEAKGGAERVLAQVSSGLAERDHDVSLISCEPSGGQSYYPLSDKVKRLCLGIGNSMEHATVGETFARIKAIRRIIKDQKPDVVVGFMHSMFIPVSIAAIGTGVPVIASEHIVPAHYKSRPLQFLLLILSSFLVKRITVLSQAVRTSYPQIMRHKMVVIPNPVEPPKPTTKERSDSKHVILNVGRLDPQKNQHTLIEAFATLAPKYPEWNVQIFGDGPLKDSLEQLIRKLSLQNRVFLMGTTKDISREYSKTDIFAMPSEYESFGLATAEAMSYGVPAIGFMECPGTNEIITNDVNGLLVSRAGKDQIEAFATGLNSLISDQALRTRLGEEAKKSVLKYKLDSVIDAWNELIDNQRTKHCS